MDIPVNAQIRCSDDVGGHISRVIINPISEEVTHLVVKGTGLRGKEYLVPVHLVVETDPEEVTLNCTHEDLKQMQPFVETDYVKSDKPLEVYTADQYMTWPYLVMESVPEYVPIEREHIPVHELAIRRGTAVKATDGTIGEVSEFLVNSDNDHITHIVLREGHLWGKRDIVIPVSYIEQFDDESVELNVSKTEIEKLPHVPVRRISM